MSSYENPTSVDSLSDEGDDVEHQLPWVTVLPEDDRSLFTEEMFQLMAEAAQDDDSATVEQALREGRVMSLTYSEPKLKQLLRQPLIANGERAPRPVVWNRGGIKVLAPLRPR